MADVKGYITPELSKSVRETDLADRGQFLLVPIMGFAADFDFLNTLYATPTEMAKLLDGGRRASSELPWPLLAQSPPYTLTPGIYTSLQNHRASVIIGEVLLWYNWVLSVFAI